MYNNSRNNSRMRKLRKSSKSSKSSKKVNSCKKLPKEVIDLFNGKGANGKKYLELQNKAREILNSMPCKKPGKVKMNGGGNIIEFGKIIYQMLQLINAVYQIYRLVNAQCGWMESFADGLLGGSVCLELQVVAYKQIGFAVAKIVALEGAYRTGKAITGSNNSYPGKPRSLKNKTN